MGDKLENFIVQNRADLDSLEPKPLLWDKIESKLPSQKIRSMGDHIWKVAAMILFCSTVYLLGQQWKVDKPSHLVYEDLSEIELYYQEIISSKKVTLVNYDQAVYSMMAPDLGQLESDYQSLRDKMNEVGAHDGLKAALIQNLRLRVQLLNQQIAFLEEIEKVKENKSNEKEI